MSRQTGQDLSTAASDSERRTIFSVCELMAEARARRERADIWEIMSELRANLADSEVGAVVRLFRGYCD